MADWKQITARIRRARSGKDPLAQLANLYQKTSDAMVAFELAKLFESSGQNSDAASGIPRQRQNSGEQNGRVKRKKRWCGLAEVPWRLLQANPSKRMENSAWSRPNPLKKNKNRRSKRIPRRWNRR